MPQDFKRFTDESQDGRRKIPTTEHKRIRELYQELKSFRKVAKLYGVDKRTIQFIVNPKMYKEFKKKRYQKKPWLDYYNKETHTPAIRKYRAKKRALGLIVVRGNKKKRIAP